MATIYELARGGSDKEPWLDKVVIAIVHALTLMGEIDT